MWIHELKGTGDLDPFEQVSHRFISGIDDESIGYAADSLAKLRKEVEARVARLKKLDRAICPDKKITRQIANNRRLHLHPLACFIDEMQNLFAHPKFGKQAADDAVFIIKIGRALGVFLILATQRPDKESCPTGVSGNVSTRFCLKVAGQMENDMILGTSAYKNGARATTFRAKVDAGLGYLKGEENVPKVVRTYYLNTADTERAAIRARAIREAAGTLSGVALGEYDTTPKRDVLADVREVFGGEPGLHWDVIAERLAERFPDRWDGASPDAVSAECRAAGVPSVVVNVAGERGRGCRLDALDGGGERVVTRYRGNAAVTSLTCTDTRRRYRRYRRPPVDLRGNSNGCEPGIEALRTPWGSSRAPAAEHRYQTCDDEWCDRFPCRVYREGYEAGYGAGSAAGYAAGRADGYAEGYADGQADAAE